MPRKTTPPNSFERLRAAMHFLSARTHRHYGLIYADQREFVDAVDEYTRALSYNPSLRRAYLERGILYWRELNHPRRAIMDLKAALALSPGWPEALFCRAMAFQAAGEFPSAINDLSEYLRSNDSAWRVDAERQLALLRSLVGEALPVGNSS